jgi:hypothetical protein
VDTAVTLAEPRPAAAPGAADDRWRVLFRAGGVAALLSALFIPIQIVVFVASNPPFDGTAADWFALLSDDRLVGLVDLDLLLVADNVLLIPILLALYVLLRRAQASVMLLATAFGFTSVAMYIATNPAVEMASLADTYAGAATEAERASALAAAETLLATWQGTAFQTAYLVGSLAGIAIGAVMLRSGVFGRPTAYMAILGNAIGLGLYLPEIGVYVSVFSVLFLEVWYVLVARRLFVLGRDAAGGTAAGRPAAGTQTWKGDLS